MQVPLTRFAASPLSTLSHKGRGEEGEQAILAQLWLCRPA